MPNAQSMTRRDYGAAARRFVRACESGALATLSQRYAGHPFGSVVVFSLDREASPVILVSRLAEHSRNLEQDSRASLLVRGATADPLSDARVTLVAHAEKRAPDQPLLARFLRQLPQARELLALGDFYFLVLRPVAIRYIAAFGAIHWIEPGDYVPPSSDIAEAEHGLIGAIVSAHENDLRQLCHERLGREPHQIELIGLDCDGLDLRADRTRLRFDFSEPLLRAADAIHAVADLASRHSES